MKNTSNMSEKSNLKQRLKDCYQEKSKKENKNESNYATDANCYDLCKGVEECSPIEQEVIYRDFAPLNSENEKKEIKDKKIACTKIKKGNISIVKDFRFLQTWRFDKITIGDLSKVISLAPLEKKKYFVSRIQKLSYQQKKSDSFEFDEQNESNNQYKDTINVLQSTSNTKGWNINGSVGVIIPAGNVPIQVSASGGYSSTTTNSTQSSIQKINEATQKSASRLKKLNKLEVSESSEKSDEFREESNLENPYRDRSLDCFYYEMLKHYKVNTRLQSVSHALVLEIEDLEWDNTFILTNGDFLVKNLLDPMLSSELSGVLESYNKNFQVGGVNKKVNLIADTAFKWIFEQVVSNEGIFETGKGEIFKSFSRDTGEDGFDDAKDKEFIARAYAILGFYYRLYHEIKDTDEYQLIKVDLVQSLAKEVGYIFDKHPFDKESFRHVFDEKQHTEVFRRVPGFLALVRNTIFPMLGMKRKEDEEIESLNQSSHTIDLIEEHLKCYSTYYRDLYLNYLSNLTNNSSFVELITNSIDSTDFSLEEATDLFDFNDGELIGNKFIVPNRTPLTIEEYVKYFDKGHDEVQNIESPDFTISIPTDGYHVEAIKGNCILENVPKPYLQNCCK